MAEIAAQLERLDNAAALIGTPESPGRVMESVQLALDLLARGEADDIALARRIVEAVIGLQRQPPADTITHEARDRVRRFAAGPCRLRLFEQPAGETTQLHDDHWQAAPLLESPAVAIWPGEFLRPEANV